MAYRVHGMLRPSWIGVLAVALVFAASQARSAPPPIADFFDNPAISHAALSPDGKTLALRSGGKDVRETLGVLDLATFQLKVLVRLTGDDVDDFRWVNNQRLVFTTTDRTLAPGQKRYGPGLSAINIDGSRMRQLVRREGDGLRQDGDLELTLLPWNTQLLPQEGAQNSDAVYVTSPRFDIAGTASSTQLLRLNTVTGRTVRAEGPPNTWDWVLDQAGEPRLAVTNEGETTATHYRDPASNSWRKLAAFHRVRGGAGAFSPLTVAADGTVYVLAQNGADTTGLHTYDLAAGQLSAKPLLLTPGYDFSGELVFNRGKLAGVSVLTDTESTVWFDPDLKALQSSIDALLPATVNLITIPTRAETPWVLVTSFSDLVPKRYALFNKDTKALRRVGDAHPKIEPARMGQQEMLRFKARDGRQIPALLTLPGGVQKIKLPLVVLVHGGPFVRGTRWGWRAQSQFLASRGYAVLEPEFRGSTGFGNAHFVAGWKQWGLAMQDDVADATGWAIAQGIADPARICIAGASYGGYAALMGLIRDPALYRCGINWVGVTDLKLLYQGHWSAPSDQTDEERKYGFPALIGDPVADVEQFKATSPLLLASRIKQPLLLAYGGVDRRVPIYHGQQFYDAVAKTNPDVEWIAYDHEGHGWHLPKTAIDFWGRVEKFLDRNIGAQAPK